jgi:uncharacterized protein involved in exopolysaccharide biosynthesis
VSARKYTLGEIWHLAVTHRWHVLVPVAIGLATAPLLAPWVPLRYRSEALILVEPPQVPGVYVQQTVKEPVEARLPAITARILSRARLEQIILDMDLYKEERKRDVMEDVVEKMRLRDVRTAPTGKDTDTFRVSYISNDADTAQKVTERLAALYIEQNALERASQAESTTELIATRIEDTKRRLTEVDKKLEEYRKAHAGQLPTQLQGNLTAIQSLNMQLSQLNETANRALENRMRIESELAALDSVPLPQGSQAGGPSGTGIPSTAELLEAARSAREQLLKKYRPGHPALEDMERTIADLTERLANEAPLSTRTTAVEKPMTAAEAAQQRRRLDLEGQRQIIDHSLSRYRNEEAVLKRQIAQYQGRVDVLPTRETELQELTREYNTLNTAYADLLLKRESASLNATMERREIGERFALLDPATQPDRPYNQLQRIAAMGAGAAAGFVIAILIIGLMEYRDTSFRSSDEVVQALSLPVLASIPTMTSAGERQTAVRRQWAMDIGGSALLLVSVAVVVVWQLSQ